jgi:hypothetical protein
MLRAVLALAALGVVAGASVSKLLEKEAASKWGLIEVNDKTLADALGPSKAEADTFSSILLFTTDNPQLPCPACAVVEREVAIVRRALNGSSLDKPVFFFKVRYSAETQQTFGRYAMKSVPLVALRPAGWRDFGSETQPHKPVELSSTELAVSDSMGSSGAAASAKPIIEMLYKHAVIPSLVEPLRPASEVRPIVAFFGAVLGVMGALLASMPSLREAWCVKSPWFWFGVAVAVHWVSISGIVFDIIRNPPWYGVNSRGKPSIVGAQERSEQFVLEGLFMGALSLAASVCLILLLRAAKRTRSELTLAITAGILLALFMSLYWRYVQSYEQKTSWYSVKGTIPSKWFTKAKEHASLVTTFVRQSLDQIGLPRVITAWFAL